MKNTICILLIALASCVAEVPDARPDAGGDIAAVDEVSVTVWVRFWRWGAEVPCSESQMSGYRLQVGADLAHTVTCARELAAPTARVGSGTFEYTHSVDAGAVSARMVSPNGIPVSSDHTLVLDAADVVRGEAWRFITVDLD